VARGADIEDITHRIRKSNCMSIHGQAVVVADESEATCKVSDP